MRMFPLPSNRAPAHLCRPLIHAREECLRTGIGFYRLRINLGKNVPSMTGHFREYATVSPEGMPWFYPDHRHGGRLGFARARAGEVWYAGGDTDGRWHLCSEGNPHA